MRIRHSAQSFGVFNALWSYAIAALSPVLGYVLFLLFYVGIDVIRSILTLGAVDKDEFASLDAAPATPSANGKFGRRFGTASKRAAAPARRRPEAGAKACRRRRPKRPSLSRPRPAPKPEPPKAEPKPEPPKAEAPKPEPKPEPKPAPRRPSDDDPTQVDR